MSTSLSNAKTITSSLHRSRAILYKTLNGSETAVNQLTIDGEYISETLDEHKYTIKTSLSSTKSRLLTVKSYEYWEKYSLHGKPSHPSFISTHLFHFMNLFFRINFLLFSCCFLHSCQKITDLYDSFHHFPVLSLPRPISFSF